MFPLNVILDDTLIPSSVLRLLRLSAKHYIEPCRLHVRHPALTDHIRLGSTKITTAMSPYLLPVLTASLANRQQPTGGPALLPHQPPSQTDGRFADPSQGSCEPNGFENPWKVFALSLIAIFLTLVCLFVAFGLRVVPSPLPDEEAAADSRPVRPGVWFTSRRLAREAVVSIRARLPGLGLRKAGGGTASTKQNKGKGKEASNFPVEIIDQPASPKRSYYRRAAHAGRARFLATQDPSGLPPVAESSSSAGPNGSQGEVLAMPSSPKAPLPYPRGSPSPGAALYPKDVDKESDITDRDQATTGDHESQDTGKARGGPSGNSDVS